MIAFLRAMYAARAIADVLARADEVAAEVERVTDGTTRIMAAIVAGVNRTGYVCPCGSTTYGDCVDECGRCGRRRGARP